MSTRGIFTAEGSVLEMDDPYDLGLERIAFLKARRPLFCGCRPESTLPLTVVESARTPHVRRVRDVDQHAAECVFHRDYQAVGLAGDRWSEKAVSCGVDASTAEGFRRLVRAVFSRSYTNVMVQSGANTSIRDCLTTVRAELAAGLYLNGGESLVAAAKRQGGQLFWGIVDHLADPGSIVDGDWPLVVHPFLKDGTRVAPRCLLGPTSVIAEALRATSVWGRPIAMPYFAMGVVDVRDWRVCRVAFMPVALDLERIAAVDSAAERRAILRYWKQGARVYKPVRRRELNQLPPLWRSRLGLEIEFSYRPDFLLLDEHAVVELIGFGDEHAAYGRTWAAKRAYWKTMETAGHFSLHELRMRESLT